MLGPLFSLTFSIFLSITFSLRNIILFFICMSDLINIESPLKSCLALSFGTRFENEARPAFERLRLKDPRLSGRKTLAGIFDSETVDPCQRSREINFLSFLSGFFFFLFFYIFSPGCFGSSGDDQTLSFLCFYNQCHRAWPITLDSP